jgi:hypothetical protein
MALLLKWSWFCHFGSKVWLQTARESDRTRDSQQVVMYLMRDQLSEKPPYTTHLFIVNAQSFTPAWW